MSKSGRDSGRSERAARIQAQQARQERTRVLAIVGAVVAVLAVLATLVVFSLQQESTPTEKLPAVAASKGDHSLVVGDRDDAPVKVVVYEDFLCPFCREFEQSTRDFLRRAAAKGTVQVEYRPFHYLPDDYSVEVLNSFAAVLEHSTPKKALAFHDYAFEHQPYEQDPDKPGLQDMQTWATKVGATEDGVEEAISTRDQAWIQAADAAATKAGVDSTPTVFANGQEVQGETIQKIADSLERIIADAG